MADLEEAGLGHLAPKLVESCSCSTVAQLLRLSRTELQALLDSMRLLPGRRQALISFLDAKRTQARSTPEAEAAPRDRGSARDQRRMESEWAMTREAVRRAAACRARSTEFGPNYELTNGPLLNWGRSKGEPIKRVPLPTARISSVRVLKVGKSLVTVHGDRVHADCAL